MTDKAQNQTKEEIDVPSAPVTRTLVSEARRPSFTPAYFGRQTMLIGEALIYKFAGTLAESYSGGYWEFYELSNDGFYMAPASPSNICVAVYGNDYEGVVSADAFGIIVTLFTLGDLAARFAGSSQGEAFTDRYHHLREYVFSHPEADEILRAID